MMAQRRARGKTGTAGERAGSSRRAGAAVSHRDQVVTLRHRRPEPPSDSVRAVAAAADNSPRLHRPGAAGPGDDSAREVPVPRLLSVVANPAYTRPLLMAFLLGACCFYFVAAGRYAPGAAGTIQIEYGMHAQEFEGLDVEIDGQVAGPLKPFASSTRAGFAVKEGQHRVRLLTPNLPSRGEKVQVYAGSSVLLLLEVEDRVGEDGARGVVLTFER